MTRKLKVLGLALVAVFAFGAVAASGAQATTHTTEAASYPAIITAHQEAGEPLVFSAGWNNLTCSNPTLEATIEGPTTAVTAVPTFEANGSTCELGGHPLTVTNNHCAYVFEGATSKEGHGAAKLECAEGGSIQIYDPTNGCTATFGAQTPSKGVHYTNITEGGVEEVTISSTVEGIRYSWNNFFCYFGGSGSDGRLTGAAIAKGYVDNGPANTGTAKTTPTLNEGSQINLTFSSN